MPKSFMLGNVSGSLDGTTLTLTIDISHRGGLSSTGKTVQVASTQGNVTIPGTDVKVGLNAYVKA